jgi:hypothetical protein
VNANDNIYAFVWGADASYAGRFSDAHETIEAARADARGKRLTGWYTGRVRKVSRSDYAAASAAVAAGRRPAGF